MQTYTTTTTHTYTHPSEQTHQDTHTYIHTLSANSHTQIDTHAQGIRTNTDYHASTYTSKRKYLEKELNNTLSKTKPYHNTPSLVLRSTLQICLKLMHALLLLEHAIVQHQILCILYG